jgi:two-component system, OmpR family, sensor kinase
MVDRVNSALRGTGTRTRLAIAIALIVLGALVATFVAVYRGTGSDLRGQMDRDLAEDAGALAHHVRGATGASAKEIADQAQRYIDSQPTFGPSSELLVVKAGNARLATNAPELLGVGREPGETSGESQAEAREPSQILSAPDGYSTLELADAGQVRLLSQPVFEGGGRSARIVAGEPLDQVQAAESGISRTFLIAGSLALAAAIAAGVLVAGRSTGPLRRMALVAGAVDAGDLSTRMEPDGPSEARRLAESFNHMLDRLEEAFARQRAFTSDASHELRTPLTAIRGQIEVLSRSGRSASSEEIEATAAIVTREVDRMRRLVDDMLLLAQMDEGLAHDPRPTPVDSLMADAVDGIAAGLDRQLDIAPAPGGTVVVDHDRIVQVIRNLLRNAVEHTERGGEIHVSCDAAANGALRVTVSDDGPGIPASERERIFVRFHRVESSRDRRTGGTGLGLAIARAIVQAHGGRIWADAAPAGGARITFELPGYRADGR